MRLIFLPFLLVCASCAYLPQEEKASASFAPVSFSEMENWQADNAAEALAAFQKSCPSLRFKEGWKDVCVIARAIPQTDDVARKFFEAHFTPYAVSDGSGATGLFTGYYVPELRGALRKGGKYRTPLYARPDDLITANLGDFKPELKGLKIVGKVKKDKFIPYDERAKIAKGSLAPRAKPIVWIDNPVDGFFLEVQGSGIVRLPNKKYVLLGYDGANGRPYKAIGRELADRGALQRPVTMPAIRGKLASEDRAHAQEIMNWNPSYVFFRRLPGNDVLGAQGIALTPRRSLAVDPKVVPLGAPVWLDTADGKGQAIQRLMIAQDTGGAIKGAVRGDFFWGSGAEAAEQAGSMQSQGRAYVLMPKGMKPDDK